MRKSLFTAMLILVLAFCACAAGEMSDDKYQIGDRINDFSVETISGETVTLSGLLGQKDMVLINLWATWCGPCRFEFPFMQRAYDEYSDRIAILALSCDPDDEVQAIEEFAGELGLTFYMGQDMPNLSEAFAVWGIPTSIVIDRFGVICFIETGALPDTDSFIRLFDFFVDEGYTDSILLDELPTEKTETRTEAVFSIQYLDQNGDPVPGTVCQVCNDTTCQLFTADENGLCAFTLEPYPWEIHTLMVPKGYEGDTQTVTISGMYGGEYVFTLTKK